MDDRNPIGTPPEIEDRCSAKELGAGDLVDCLVENPVCRWALAFGYGHFCHHPRRSEIVSRTREIGLTGRAKDR